MGDRSAIEWTEATWNPIVGCSVVSPGCANCYAMKMAARIERMAAGAGKWTHYNGTTQASKAGPVWTGRLTLAPGEILTAPLRWKRPRRIFVNSMSDLFHEAVPDEWIDRIFAVMAMCPQHTFQVLTKRSARMREYMNGIQSKIPFLGRMPLERIHLEAAAHMEGDGGFMDALKDRGNVYSLYLDAPWALPNVWLGVSTEDQRRADERVQQLRETPAAVRFISAEPLLGAIDFEPWLDRIDWIIVGGESGPGARPMHPDWPRSIRDQCAQAGTAFFFKQWGEYGPEGLSREGWLLRPDGSASPDPLPNGIGRHPRPGYAVMYRIGKKAAGRLLDGREHNDMPEGRA